MGRVGGESGGVLSPLASPAAARPCLRPPGASGRFRSPERAAGHTSGFAPGTGPSGRISKGSRANPSSRVGGEPSARRGIDRRRSRSQVPIPFAEVALGLSSPGDQPGSAPRGRLGPCNAPTGVEVQGLRSGAQGEGLKVKGSRSRAQGPGLEARGIDAPEHTGGAPVTHANAELRPPDGRERAR